MTKYYQTVSLNCSINLYYQHMKVHSGLIFPNLLVVSIYILPIVKKFKHFFCLCGSLGFSFAHFSVGILIGCLLVYRHFFCILVTILMLALYTNIVMIFFSVVSFPGFEKLVFCIVLLLLGVFFLF